MAFSPFKLIVFLGGVILSRFCAEGLYPMLLKPASLAGLGGPFNGDGLLI